MLGGSAAFSYPLPEEYSLLERFFSSMEASAPLLWSRKATAPFSVIRNAIEPAVRKTFSEEHLGKILTIYPEAFTISRDKQTGKLLVQMPHAINGTSAISIAEVSQKRRLKFRENLVLLLEKNKKIVARKMPQIGESYEIENRLPLTDAENLQKENTLRCLVNNKREVIQKSFEAGRQTKRKSSSENRQKLGEIPNTNERNVNAALDKKRRVATGLKGLPSSLLDAVRERQEREREMDPEAVARRQRKSAMSSLPALFDLVYVHFRSIRKNKCEMEKLIDMLAQHRGNSSGWRPAISQTNEKKMLIREQLEMLLKLVPEFCRLSNSTINPGSKLFVVKLNGIDISAARARLL